MNTEQVTNRTKIAPTVQQPTGTKMAVALIGARGQLGTDIAKILPEATCLGHSEIELSSSESIQAALDLSDADVVINCAAYNLVDKAEDDPIDAYEVNALGPRRLAQYCAERDKTLVHFSSDYVFGLEGIRDVPYVESDAPGPQSAYAASKLQGEFFVRSLCPKHFVIRTCGLYGVAALQGAGKGNFIETMIRLGRERDELGIVNDQHCTPTATADLADATLELVASKTYGLYHATNNGATTWFGLANAVFERLGISVKTNPVSTADFGAKAARPPYSILNCQKLEAVIGRNMPTWEVALDKYLAAREAFVY
jgi:dTDP-4-dehydrorhamnose reductase